MHLIFAWGTADVLTEILAEERRIGEGEQIADLLDGVLSAAQQGLGVQQHASFHRPSVFVVEDGGEHQVVYSVHIFRIFAAKIVIYGGFLFFFRLDFARKAPTEHFPSRIGQHCIAEKCELCSQKQKVKQIMRRTVLSLSFIICNLSFSAAQTMSLKQCIETGLERNLGVRTVAEDVRTADVTRSENRSKLLKYRQATGQCREAGQD